MITKARVGQVNTRRSISLVLRLFIPVLFSLTAVAQGLVGDVLAGNLVKPKVGQWALYDLKDTTDNKSYVVRQAIVGEERVGRKKGYWLEVEITPLIGFPVVYKMLVTGPASDPRNVHRILFRQGNGTVQEVPVEPTEPVGQQADSMKESLGSEEVTTPAGILSAEHYTLKTEDGTDHVWISDTVRPMGIVRMRSGKGELILREFGTGGPHAESALERPLPEEMAERLEPKVEVGVKQKPEPQGEQ